ncbi:MAG: TrpR family trp operon transcriptional repressor [Desulforhopalus sp.]|jgi:TrpR family trp operon transcriptional repressor
MVYLYVSMNRNTTNEASEELIQIISRISDEREIERLLFELLTPQELENLTMRWQILKELYLGESQRAIASRHKMSLCKITRGSKILKKKNSITAMLIKTIYEGEKG